MYRLDVLDGLDSGCTDGCGVAWVGCADAGTLGLDVLMQGCMGWVLGMVPVMQGGHA